METVKVAYFYELKAHLGMPDIDRVEISIEIILCSSSITILNKKSGQSERTLANIRDFKVGRITYLHNLRKQKVYL